MSAAMSAAMNAAAPQAPRLALSRRFPVGAGR